MRRTSPGPRCRLAGGRVIILLAAAAALTAPPAHAQSKAAAKKGAAPAAPADTRPLARYVPRENLVFYLGTDGLDADPEGWRKTAAYKMLNETTLGVMLEDVVSQFADYRLAPYANRKVNGADVVTVAKHMLTSGFALAVNPQESGPGKPGGPVVATLVIRGGAGKDVRGAFGRLMGTLMGAAKPQMLKKSGRTIVVVPPAEGAPAAAESKAAAKDKEAKGPAELWSWWSEQNDLVAVFGPNAQETTFAVLDGKRPSAVDHPVRVGLARKEGAFSPVLVAFVDPSGVPKNLPPSPLAGAFGGLDAFFKKYLGNRFDYRLGFQDDALMSVTRLTSPRPRRSVLPFVLDQPGFDKGKLPPLPEGIESFTVVSVDAQKMYDHLMSGPTSPFKEQLTRAVESLKTDARVDLKKDLLARLGTKFAFYVIPGPTPAAVAPAAAGAASPPAGGPENPLLGLLGAGGLQVPRFTLVAEVLDPAAAGRTLDNVMIAFNKNFRERAAEAAENAPAPKAENTGDAPKRRTPPPSPEFKLTPSRNPTERSYVLNIPASLARQFPGGFRPTIRLSGKQMIVATTPEAASQALSVKPDEWVIPPDLAPAFDPLPRELTVLGARDPRSTLPETLASLPGSLQKAVNTLTAQAQAREAGAGAATGGPGAAPGGPGGQAPPDVAPPGQPGSPGAAGPAGVSMLSFNIPAANLPKADDLRSRLFPASFAVANGEQDVRVITRSAFPNVVSPSLVAGLATAMSAFQAARNAAAEAAPPPSPAAGAPAATKAATKPGGGPAVKGRGGVVPKD